jgi:hypothetical protein
MPAFHIDSKNGDLVFPELAVSLKRLSKWKSFPASLRALAGPDSDVKTG